MEEADANAKRSKPSLSETSVLLLAAVREEGRVAQQVRATPAPAPAPAPALQLLSCLCSFAWSWMLSMREVLWYIRASLWSCFASPRVCRKHNQREKSMCPQAIGKSIAFIESMNSIEWVSSSLFCRAEITQSHFRHNFINFLYYVLWITTLLVPDLYF